MAKGGGGVLHFANTAFCPGFCQACWPVPRGNEDAGLCAEMCPTRPQNSTAKTILDFIGMRPSKGMMRIKIGS